MLMYILTFVLAFCTLAGYFNKPWWFSILDFFRLHYAALSLFLLCISIWYMDPFLMAAHAVIVLVNLWRIRNFLPNFKSVGVAQQKKVMSVNAYKDNRAPKQLAIAIHEANPDLLLIMEMTGKVAQALSPVLERYTYSLETPVRDGFKISLFSKNPLDKEKITYHGPGNTPLLQARTHIEGRKNQVFSAHPKPPLSAQWCNERAAYFFEVERTINENNDLPIIMLGDFNSVPWESHFKGFLDSTQLKSTIEGYGYHTTWPAFFPLLGIPMDHILISKDKKYNDLHVGPYVGSDHYPISLNL